MIRIQIFKSKYHIPLVFFYMIPKTMLNNLNSVLHSKEETILNMNWICGQMVINLYTSSHVQVKLHEVEKSPSNECGLRKLQTFDVNRTDREWSQSPSSPVLRDLTPLPRKHEVNPAFCSHSSWKGQLSPIFRAGWVSTEEANNTLKVWHLLKVTISTQTVRDHFGNYHQIHKVLVNAAVSSLQHICQASRQ